MAETLALPDLLRHAGAVMTDRDGRPVAAHYGSAATELAVCARGVGLAVRSDLRTLLLTAPTGGLDQLVNRALGHALVAGGAALEAGAWWCRTADRDEVVLICRPDTASRLARTLRHDIHRCPKATLVDTSDEQVILGVIGRRTRCVLEALGVFEPWGDPRRVAPFTKSPHGGDAVSWLLQADTAAFVVVDTAKAAKTWHAIVEAGRPYGISCVGIESIARYLLTERAAHSHITLL